MVYKPNIPQPTNIPAQSQSDFLENFSELNTIFDVDHVTWNAASAANRGKHTSSTYIDTTDPVTATNEVAVYAKDDGGNSRLYMRQEAAGTVVQMSNRDPTIGANGETFLPGGILLKWGAVLVNSSPTAVVFANAFPNSIFSIVVTINNNNPNFSATVNAGSVSGFDIYSTKTTVTHFYFAIGN